MKKILLIAMLVPMNSYAQSSLTDQINAVDAAQTEQEWKEQQYQNAQARNIAEKRATENALKQQKEAEKLADKKRDAAYEDKLRELDLQQKALQIDAEKARVARSNDYIDQELKQQAAETDVIKSQADSQRDISQGTKSLLEKTGDAEVKKESGIFSR